MTTLDVRNELSGCRDTITLRTPRAEVIHRLQEALSKYDSEDFFDPYGEVVGSYCCIEAKRIVITAYGLGSEAVLAELNRVVQAARGVTI